MPQLTMNTLHRSLVRLLIISVSWLGSLFWGMNANAAGSLDGFNPNANSSVDSAVVQPDGKIHLLGNFSTIGGVYRQYHARILFYGPVDSTFDLSPSHAPIGIVFDRDQSIFAYGYFTSIGGVSRRNLAQISQSGVVASNPNLSSAIYYIGAMILGSNGKPVFSSQYTTPNNTWKIHRLTETNEVDGSWSVDINAFSQVASGSNGSIYLSGYFDRVDGVPRGPMVRLKSDGQIDTTFNPSFDSVPLIVLEQADGKILVAGAFTMVNGISRNGLARLLPTGELDGAFNAAMSASGGISSLALQADGKILVAGGFSSIGQGTQPYFARLSADGSFDPNFSVVVNNSISGITLLDSGSVILTGAFTRVHGVTRNRVALVHNDSATQSLTVPNSGRIQWLRGGVSAEASQVIFDLSTNGGASWTQLGNGRRISGGWELASQVLPSIGMVRGRALVPCGLNNSSRSEYHSSISFSNLTPMAEIAVEQPFGAGLEDGQATVDFGTVALPATASRTFRIKNIGTAELAGLNASFEGSNAGDFAVLSSLPTTLAAGSSTDVEVRFSPSIYGTKTASLKIQSSDADEAVFDINLTGLANESEIVVTQQAGSVNLIDGSSTVAFGPTPAGTHVSQSFTITNSGNSQMLDVILTVSGAQAFEYVVTTPPDVSIAPGGSTVFTIRFAPSLIGTRSAVLQVASNDLDENPFDITIASQSTNPDADGDNDGLTDAQEFWLGTNRNLADTDGDGANDGLEWRAGSSALLADTDADGILDLYEITHGLTPRWNDATGDVDFDGVSNLAEFNAGTLSSNFDSDGDGISDSREVLGRGFTRMWYDKNNRLLGQGFDNGVWITQDYDKNSNPTRQQLLKRTSLDQDNDRLPDTWELANGLDPNSATGADGIGDADNDGLSNLQEYSGGTDPKAATANSINDGTVIASGSAFPWTPTNYVMGTGQLDGVGIEEVVVSGDGNPGAINNVLRVITPNVNGTTWVEECVPVGAVGVTSICVGHTNAANTIFVGTRAVAPAFGQIIKFTKNAGVWTPMVMASSTDQVAWVAGFTDFSTGFLLAQYSTSTQIQYLRRLDPATSSATTMTSYADSTFAGPRFARNATNGVFVSRLVTQSTNRRFESYAVRSGLNNSYLGPVLTVNTDMQDLPFHAPGLVGLNRNASSASLIQYRWRDLDSSGSANNGDDSQMVELSSSNGLATKLSELLFAPQSGRVAVGTVFPDSTGSRNVALTGNADGVVAMWDAVAPANSQLRRRVLSAAYRGRSWHGFVSLRGIGSGESAVALSTGTSLAHPQLTLWTSAMLGQSLSSMPSFGPPLARIASVPYAGGSQSSVDLTLWDAESNPAQVMLQYRLNAWSAWNNATVLTVDDASATAFVTATPTGTRHRLLWNAAADLGNSFAGNVLLRARATDGADTGTWSEQSYFRVAATPEIAVRDLGSSLYLTDGGATIALGEITVGRPLIRAFRISNEGNAVLDNLAINGTASAWAGLSLPTLTSSSITGGGNQQFILTFTPTTAGVHTASIQFTSNDGDENPFDIALSFTAVRHVITVAVSPTSVSEDGGNSLTYTFTRISGADALTVGYTLGGTATTGVDYGVSPANTVSFAAGSTTAQLVIMPNADGDPESDETVIVSVQSGQAEFISGSPASAIGGILADELPTVVTTVPSSITPSSASIGGQITISGTTVPERGVLYSTNPVVTIINGTKVLLGSGTGSFSSTLSNLSQATTYYVRAYAINSAGTGYGNTLNFTTTTVPNGPGWTSPTGLEHSMTVYAQVDRDGSKVESTGSRLAAFQNSVVAGVAAPITGPGAIKLYQMTVWSNSTSATLPMKVYDAATDEILDIQESLSFSSNGVLGSIAVPVLLHVRPPTVDQVIPLVQGMNWISFNALPTNRAVSSVLSQHTPQNNDLIKGTQGTATYFGGEWYPTGGFTLEQSRMYILRRQASGSANLTVTGQPVDATSAISLNAGWNWLGYNPQAPRQIALALAGLNPADNDIIKNQVSGSATFFGGDWYPGNYELVPGRGFLLNLTNAQTFAYDGGTASGHPVPESHEGTISPSGDEGEIPAATSSNSPPTWAIPTGKEHSMTLYAVVEIGSQRLELPTAQLAIFEGGQVSGVANIMQGPNGKLYQLTAWSNTTSVPNMLLKAYDPNIPIIRDLNPNVTFNANGILGTISSPLLFSAPALTPIELWRHAKFGSIANVASAADTADTDDDGIANLVEYATAMNPLENDAISMAAKKVEGAIEFIYTKNKAATDLTYSVEWSDTLGDDWTSAGVRAPSILSDNGTTQQVKVNVPAGSGVIRRFVRLKVTRN
jgi:uncharacterized delta-60 repeat protein